MAAAWSGSMLWATVAVSASAPSRTRPYADAVSRAAAKLASARPSARPNSTPPPRSAPTSRRRRWETRCAINGLLGARRWWRRARSSRQCPPPADHGPACGYDCVTVVVAPPLRPTSTLAVVAELRVRLLGGLVVEGRPARE